MPIAVTTELPASSLLAELRLRGSYTDGFSLTVARDVSLAQFVEAFYTTPLFKAERAVLRLLAGRASSDIEARELGQGSRETFAVWRVTERQAQQILLTDETGRTSSWLMVEQQPSPGGAVTRLYFGSAITPRSNRLQGPGGPPQFSPVFHALLGLHKVYSRQLLQAAAARLLRLDTPRATGSDA